MVLRIVWPALDRSLEALAALGDSIVENLRLVPGMHVVLDYIKRSYQHDPVRIVFEALLGLFALSYFLRQPRERKIKLTEKVKKILIR